MFDGKTNDRVLDIVAAMSDEVIRALRLAKQITHPGESGRAREHVLSDFVRRLVPSSFNVGTGFVIDSAGAISRQIDVVVYRTDYAPVFNIGGVTHFLVESVALAIEVKAGITSREELRSAVENIASVKRLDRTGAGENYILRGNANAGSVSPEAFEHQIFGAIVTEDSLAIETFIEAFIDCLHGLPKREWPNTYVDVDSWGTGYVHDSNRDDFDPTDTRTLSVSASPPAPLIGLAQGIMDYLRVAELIDFGPERYLPIQYDFSGRYDIPE